MRFEWDSTKRLRNLQRHAIDFGDVFLIFKSITVTNLDERFDYGERRFLTFGILEGIVIAVAHTENDECIRIISARKADKDEQKIYFNSI